MSIKRIVCNSIILFFLFVCLIGSSTIFGTELSTLAISTYAGPPLSNQSQTGICDTIIKTAFQSLGIQVDISHLPAERSILNANLGILDGDFVRISGLGSIYPNLIEVPEKILSYDFVAFTRDYPLKTISWEQLTPYHVGIVRGWKILEEHLAGVKKLNKVKNQQLLFTMLDKNRVDMVVYARLEGLWVIQELGIDRITVLSPSLVTRDMFLYLNRKHHSLVPKLAATLREMKKDGRFDRIFKTEAF